jgi:hypothetical protein
MSTFSVWFHLFLSHGYCEEASHELAAIAVALERV